MPDNPFQSCETVADVLGHLAWVASASWEKTESAGAYDSARVRTAVTRAGVRIQELAAVVEEHDRPRPRTGTLSAQIARVLNSHSRENASNTPDYLLAEYLLRCLEAGEILVARREKWYGVELEIGRTWVEEKAVLEP
jgi:hypothetical protein